MSAEQIAMGLIQKWESCSLTAYPDPISGGDPWTIGWGATGPDIKQGMIWTQTQADVDLFNRVVYIGRVVRSYIKVTVTDNQLAALIDFAYNEGTGALRGSTLLQDLNDGYPQKAADGLLEWDMAQGKMVPGLENRREDERRVFLT